MNSPIWINRYDPEQLAKHGTYIMNLLKHENEIVRTNALELIRFFEKKDVLVHYEALLQTLEEDYVYRRHSLSVNTLIRENRYLAVINIYRSMFCPEFEQLSNEWLIAPEGGKSLLERLTSVRDKTDETEEEIREIIHSIITFAAPDLVARYPPAVRAYVNEQELRALDRQAAVVAGLLPHNRQYI